MSKQDTEVVNIGDKVYYTLRKIAADLKVTPETIRYWNRLYGMPWVSIGNTRLICPLELNEWLRTTRSTIKRGRPANNTKGTK